MRLPFELSTLPNPVEAAFTILRDALEVNKYLYSHKNASTANYVGIRLYYHVHTPLKYTNGDRKRARLI